MAKSTRPSKADKKSTAKSSKTADVEVVEEAQGMGFVEGASIVIALVLIAAIVLVDHELGALGQGIFGRPPPPPGGGPARRFAHPVRRAPSATLSKRRPISFPAQRKRSDAARAFHLAPCIESR
jgi:hypothetical protein